MPNSFRKAWAVLGRVLLLARYTPCVSGIGQVDSTNTNDAIISMKAENEAVIDATADVMIIVPVKDDVLEGVG